MLSQSEMAVLVMREDITQLLKLTVVTMCQKTEVSVHAAVSAGRGEETGKGGIENNRHKQKV